MSPNNPEPSCPNDMNPENLKLCNMLFKGKPKTDLTKRKRIQKKCTTRNPSVSCPKIIR